MGSRTLDLTRNVFKGIYAVSRQTLPVANSYFTFFGFNVIYTLLYLLDQMWYTFEYLVKGDGFRTYYVCITPPTLQGALITLCV